MIHEEAQLLLAAGAVLEDLSPDERAAYDAHRFGCHECAALETELSMVLADLALVVPERMPPPELFAGIRLAIDAEDARAAVAASSAGAPMTQAPGPVAFSAPLPPAPAPAPTPVAVPDNVVSIASARSSRRPVYGALALAAVFAFAAVGLGAQSTSLQTELDSANAQVSSLRSELAMQSGVMAAAVNPDHRTVALTAESVAPGATAMVVYVPGTKSSYVVAENLPPTPDGHGYQLWYADEAGVHGLQTVAFDGNGAFVAPFDVDLANSTAVMITLEPTGGAAGEPGPQVVFGEL